MFKDAVVIFKKELKNIFKEKRTIFSLFFLPLLLMPLIFTSIGYVSQLQEKDAEERVYNIVIENIEDSEFLSILDRSLNFKVVDQYSPEEDLKIVFPNNFNPGDKASIKVFYNSNSTKNQHAFDVIRNSISEYENYLTDKKLSSYNLSLNKLNT
ncbi:hypothetical protein [Oceanotoga teriensis]|nr:hypothetical protein [Oceanotoga teriensis]MDO7977220.1 hypothetical protein [Oceanotoga teriensis]